MLTDLNETLRQLLLKHIGPKLANLQISFDIPTRDWSARVGGDPMINLYLYDVHENLELRDMSWDKGARTNGKVTLKRQPVWLNLSYMVTCWTREALEQHRLLWWVLETLYRYSPLPVDELQGDLRQSDRPVRTEVAQPDGVLKNLSEFWASLENQIRPAINLVVTLDLDAYQELRKPSLTGGLILDMRLRGRQEIAPQPVPLPNGFTPHFFESVGSGKFLLFIMVQDSQHRPIAASVALTGPANMGRESPLQPAPLPVAPGIYIFAPVAPGSYQLSVEVAGHRVARESFTVPLRPADDPLARVQVHQVEIAAS